LDAVPFAEAVFKYLTYGFCELLGAGVFSMFSSRLGASPETAEKNNRFVSLFLQRLSDLIGPYRGTYRIVYRVL